MFAIENREQRRRLYYIILLISLTATVPPWNKVKPSRISSRGGVQSDVVQPAGYAALWDPPRMRESEQRNEVYTVVALDRLLLSWIAIAGVGSVFLLMARPKKPGAVKLS